MEITHSLENHEFSLTIKLDNDAFNESTDAAFIEIARILRHSAAKIEQGQTEMSLFDVNGNRVGATQIVHA